MTNLYVIKKINDLIGAFMLIYFFNKSMQPKNKKYNKVYSIVMIIFYASISSTKMNAMIYEVKNNQIIIFIFAYHVLVLVYPLIFIRGKMSEKFFWSVFYIAMMLVGYFAVYTLLSVLFNITIAEMMASIDYKMYIAMILNKLIQCVLVFTFINNINFIKYIEDKILYVRGIILICDHIILFIISRHLIVSQSATTIETIIIVFSLCIIEILSVYTLKILYKETEAKFILKMNLKRKIYDEEIIDMYKEMIGWKHDFRNHINMILGLLEVGTKEDAIKYIYEINSSINKLDENIYTNNIAVNSILSSKMKVAKEKGIKINLDLKITSEIKISNVDICIILGNLLDNSIEACDLINKYKFIDLKIVSENSRLIIKIENNTNGYVNKANGKFLTTKCSPMNGIGLTQVDSVVKKYNGYINRKHKNNIFTTYVMIQ